MKGQRTLRERLVAVFGEEQGGKGETQGRSGGVDQAVEETEGGGVMMPSGARLGVTLPCLLKWR